jgi:hypothetical protein
MPNKHTFRSLEQLLSLKKYEVPSQEAWQQFEHSFQRKLFAACVPQPTPSLRGLFNFEWLLGIKFAFAAVFSIAICVSAFFVLKPTKAVFELPKHMAVVQNQVFAKKSVQLSSQRPLMYAASCVVASNHTQNSQQATCYAF